MLTHTKFSHPRSVVVFNFLEFFGFTALIYAYTSCIVILTILHSFVFNITSLLPETVLGIEKLKMHKETLGNAVCIFIVLLIDMSI